MKYIKVSKVKIILENQEVELDVNHSLPFNKQNTCARVLAEAVVGDDGTFEPWNRAVYQAFILLTEYANMPIPAEWSNNELMDFVNSNEYKKIYNVIDQQEFVELMKMADQMIEHRKAVCRRNGFVEFIDNIKELLSIVTQAYQDSPEAAEMFMSSIVGSVFGGGASEEGEEETANLLENLEAVNAAKENGVEVGAEL